jgi:hypothetical protein
MCWGVRVVGVFYGDDVSFAAGWWGRCSECGYVVKVLSFGTEEYPEPHPWGGWEQQPLTGFPPSPKRRA